MKNIAHDSRILAGTKMGKELFRMKDSEGEIVVTQRGSKRVLSFGSGMEQSSVYIDKPGYLAHEYTQVMLLGFVLVEAKHVTLLGLGGGSLASCLNTHFPFLAIQVVELRQAVIDVAYDWFSLPSNPQLNVCQGDAYLYLSNVESLKTDLIFSDLYEENGMSDLQEQKHYFERCYGTLSDNGCLVINLHKDPEFELSLMCILQDLFENVRVCNVLNGNWILFCEKGESQFDSDSLNVRTQSLVDQVKMPLRYYFRNMRFLS